MTSGYFDEKRPAPHVRSQRSYSHWTRVASGLSLLVIYLFIRSLSPNPTPQRIRTPSDTLNPAYLVRAEHGAIATENHRCSNIGVDIMRKGGNAVDAAVAATFCIGVVNSFSSGIGGGGYMVVRVPPARPGLPVEVVTLNFRETSPKLSNATMYQGRPKDAIIGGLAVGVPGEVRGLYEASQRWGKLPWADLVRPSAILAKGWKVDPELARRLPWFEEALLLEFPEWKAIFAPEGRALRYGEDIRRTNLSRTLFQIAEEGPQAFYAGPIADSMIRAVQEAGGILTHEDLANFAVQVTPALMGTYRGKKVYTTGAPSSGPSLLHMLNIAEQYDFEERDALAVHRLTEALKYGFAARTRIGDPPYLNTSDVDTILRIPSKSFAKEVLPNITDDSTHPPSYYNPIFDLPTDHGTSHISVADEAGWAVSVTSTVNGLFGSFILDDSTGIIMNNEQGDFSIPGSPNLFGLWPSPYNYPEPGKQPLSSMTSVIVDNEDGSFFGSFGGAGGSMIFGAVFQVMLNIIEWGMDPSSAVEYARIHDQLYPLQVMVDDTMPTDVINGLLERHHNVTVADINRVAAVVNVVTQHEDGRLYAASDSRKNGIASGY